MEYQLNTMKRYIYFLSLASSMLLCLSANSAVKSKKTASAKKTPISSEALDDSRKREAWEFERQRDPITNKIPDRIREKELAFAATLPSDRVQINGRTAQTVNYTARGPYNYGGRTRAFAYDFTNENILFAGAVSGGMWRSVNGGTSWTKVSSPAINQSVTCIAQDKRSGHTNVWYYGSGEAYGASASGGSAFI